MPTHSLPVSSSAIAARLQAAGCVFAEAEAQLLVAAARTAAELDAMVDRRVNGLPLEHVIGWAEFCGLRIVLEPGVFVPRRRTEFLVGQAAALAPPRAVILDLCCGSGAVGAVLASTLDPAELYAADLDPAAVSCARRNLHAMSVFEGDLFEPLPASLRGRVDVLVANTPYVPSDEIRLLPSEARLHESRMALDGGGDGLDIQRRVAIEAPQWLAPGGHLLIETSERQAPQTVNVFERSGLEAWVRRDHEVSATVVIGRRRGAQSD